MRNREQLCPGCVTPSGGGLGVRPAQRRATHKRINTCWPEAITAGMVGGARIADQTEKPHNLQAHTTAMTTPNAATAPAGRGSTAMANSSGHEVRPSAA